MKPKDVVKRKVRSRKISPIRWPGGKRLLAKRIISMFPEHTLYGEAFSGALHVLFHKDPSPAEAVNDINSDLINFFEIVKEKPYQLLSELRWDLPSRKLFLDYKAQFESGACQTDFQRAKLFFYVLKMSFGGKMTDYGYRRIGKPPINLEDIEGIIIGAHDRLKAVNIENIDWKRFLLKYDTPGTLFYLDPPYLCETSSRVYCSVFTKHDFEELNDVLKCVKGKFILSLNVDPFLRELFDDFEIIEVDTRYSMRSDDNWKVKELLIKNFCNWSGYTIGIKGCPLIASLIAQKTLIPFFFAVDIYDLILQKNSAPCLVLKEPDIFCWSFIIRMSRSP